MKGCFYSIISFILILYVVVVFISVKEAEELPYREYNLIYRIHYGDTTVTKEDIINDSVYLNDDISSCKLSYAHGYCHYYICSKSPLEIVECKRIK